MPSKYTRKTNRSSRSPEDVLARAAKLVNEEGSSLRQAANSFDVDKMTLSRFMKKRQADPNCAVGYVSTSEHNKIIPTHMEQDLVAHITKLAAMYYGLSLLKCKELAFEFAIQNNLVVPDSWRINRKAGVQWWLGFKSRNKLSLRKPEATSAGRACGFNEYTCKEYFDNFSAVLDKHKFTADRIFNMDETALTIVQIPDTVVTLTGMKKVAAITSGERGELVTAAYTICATGYALPPMFIFPRVNYRNHFIRGAPPGSVGKATKTGWMNEQIFVEYLDYVSGLTSCSPDNKILLIMDNLKAHVSLAAIDTARERGIVLLTIPPKTSHKLHLLDTSVYGPFKASYNRAMDNWMRCNPAKRVTIYDIPTLAHEAHLSAMIPRNIISGFKSSGNWPFNPDVFTSADFDAAAVTDTDYVPANEEESSTVSTDTMLDDQIIPVSSGNPTDSQQRSQTELSDEQPCTNTSLLDCPNRFVAETVEPSANSSRTEKEFDQDNYVSPTSIMPFPKAAPRKSSGRKRGRTRVFTDTPVRNEVAERAMSKKEEKIKECSESCKEKVVFSKKGTKTHTSIIVIIL